MTIPERWRMVVARLRSQEAELDLNSLSIAREYDYVARIGSTNAYIRAYYDLQELDVTLVLFEHVGTITKRTLYERSMSGEYVSHTSLPGRRYSYLYIDNDDTQPLVDQMVDILKQMVSLYAANGQS
jgi:hypothetical protein